MQSEQFIVIHPLIIILLGNAAIINIGNTIRKMGMAEKLNTKIVE